MYKNITTLEKEYPLKGENLRDMTKGCKCSPDVLSVNIRTQIPHKHMEVI